ncbi:MAG: tungstate ABC transporter substrate-binding protein WtpA [Candidatus Aminicenantes bacterium]
MKKILWALLLAAFLSFPGCQNNQKDTLVILHAGSLSVPFKQMAGAFMEKHPPIEVQTEAAGSRTCARKITDLESRADVMASSDSEVIKTLLIPQYADFCIDFATNEMVLMYGKKSRFGLQVSADNWHQILQEPGVEFSHSDPHADPCGYRALLVMQLAEKHYQIPNLYEKLLEKRSLAKIRPKEVDLLALLETGELDYIFIYRSVAVQHNGLYLALPDEINLSSKAHADFYKRASVEIYGNNQGELIPRRGTPIVYGLTIPKTARSPHLAAQFVGFVLSPEGQKIMTGNGQSPMNPPYVDNFEALPDLFKKSIKMEEK